jgi:DNA-binding winged helix-turn-helix (wHTH) protein
MAVWENRSVEEQDKIRMSLKSLSNLLRKNKRKKKIENVLCTRS